MSNGCQHMMKLSSFISETKIHLLKFGDTSNKLYVMLKILTKQMDSDFKRITFKREGLDNWFKRKRQALNTFHIEFVTLSFIAKVPLLNKKYSVFQTNFKPRSGLHV